MSRFEIKNKVKESELKRSVVPFTTPVFDFSTYDIDVPLRYVERLFDRLGLDPIAFNVTRKKPMNPPYGTAEVKASQKTGLMETYYHPRYDVLLRDYPKPPLNALVMIYSVDQWQSKKNRSRGVEQSGYISVSFTKSNRTKDDTRIDGQSIPRNALLLVHELCHWLCWYYGISDTTHVSDYQKGDLIGTINEIKKAQKVHKMGISQRALAEKQLADLQKTLAELIASQKNDTQ